MKASQLKELSVEEMKTRLLDNATALENLRFQKALQQLEDPTKMKQVRREIAQIKTLLRERELGLRK